MDVTQDHLLAAIREGAHAQEDALARVEDAEARFAAGQATREQVRLAWVAYQEAQVRLAEAHRILREFHTGRVRQAIAERQVG